MRQTLLLLLILSSLISFGIRKKIPLTYQITYESKFNGKARENGGFLYVRCDSDKCASWIDAGERKLISSISKESAYIDYSFKKAWTVAQLPDGSLINYTQNFDEFPNLNFSNDQMTILGHSCKKATASLRSNSIEIWYTSDLGVKGSPSMNYGVPDGLVLKIVRNGNFEITATKMIPIKEKISTPIIPQEKGESVSQPLYRHKITQQLITSIEIFRDEQISFGNPITNPEAGQLDKTYRFASGTVILKKVKLPIVPTGTKIFAELYQYSNGDAYDRTGSVFLIPTNKEKSFLDALQNGIESIPAYKAHNGKTYQGIVSTTKYEPPIELIRFFTPFGINKFNKQVNVYGMVWEDSTYYKQELSELQPLLQGECWIGVFIGNYDKGGHKVSLKLNYHPESQELKPNESKKIWIQPLFNTLNIMEMAGQEYGTLFGSDSLKVKFTVPQGVKNISFRYLSTGHGGWDGGDEYNQKRNTILLDDQVLFSHTPWRCDCATYRKYNPASGNFWNGTTSSDYSRSGWCPGTATNAVFYQLDQLQPGDHVIKVAIPMGKTEGGSFSSWNVSAILMGEY